MNIVIFGASGATGQKLVSQALEEGHFVTAFVRNPSKLPIEHEHLKIVQGNVQNYQQVEDAVRTNDVVLSALGVSKLLKHDAAVIKGVQNIVQAMERQKVKRLVYQSTFAVRKDRAELGFLVDKVFGYILRNEIADHEIKEDIIRKSNVEYVIVRPATLTNGPVKGKYRHGERLLMGKLLSTISRADVADFMLEQISNDTYLYKTPRLMN